MLGRLNHFSNTYSCSSLPLFSLLFTFYLKLTPVIFPRAVLGFTFLSITITQCFSTVFKLLWIPRSSFQRLPNPCSNIYRFLLSPIEFSQTYSPIGVIHIYTMRSLLYNLFWERYCCCYCPADLILRLVTLTIPLNLAVAWRDFDRTVSITAILITFKILSAALHRPSPRNKI